MVRRSLPFYVLLAAAALFLLSCGGGPSRDESGAVTESGDLSVFSVRIGDCFDDDASEEEVVSELAAVPCAEPHDNEAYAVFDLASGDDEWPGDDSVLLEASQGCFDRFEAFAGIAYADSALDFFPITPTEESWDAGDREVICAIYNLDLAKLTGSARDSAR